MMMRFTTGNLLEADVDAVVNTVNTVGVMGKGIALMFKEAFPANFHAYAEACEQGLLQVGQMFVTENRSLSGPRWIINFPTKRHWRNRTRIEWIDEGLDDLKRVIEEKAVLSVAIPPLGCGNGGLAWSEVRPLIEQKLGEVRGVDVVVYEPARRYLGVSKRAGVKKLTPARALIAELVRRYWVLGIECSMLEVQKLAWFLEREVQASGVTNQLKLQFEAGRYGPYADRLRHLLNALDGSYLRSEVRVPDAGPTDLIAFNESERGRVAAYIASEAANYQPALDRTAQRIDGFESPLGLEVLSTVDWLLAREECTPNLAAVKAALKEWPGGKDAGERKLRIFNDKLIELALSRLNAAVTTPE